MDGALKHDLVSLLTKVFPERSEIEQLTSFYLNMHLSSIPGSGDDTRSLFFRIVNWCESQQGNSLADLVNGAIKERPERDDLKQMHIHLSNAGLIPADNTRPSTLPTQPALSFFERAERYRAFIEAEDKGEFAKMLELSVGIENYLDVATRRKKAEDTLNQPQILVKEITEAYAVGDWAKIIKLYRQLEGNIPTKIEEYVSRAWNEIQIVERILCFSDEPVRFMAMSDNGEYMLTGTRTSQLRLWDIARGEEFAAFDPSSIRVTDDMVILIANNQQYVLIDIPFDSMRLLSGQFESSPALDAVIIECLNLQWKVGRFRRINKAHEIIPAANSISLKSWISKDIRDAREEDSIVKRDRHLALTIHDDGSLGLWDPISGRIYRMFKLPDARATVALMTPDGSNIISGWSDGCVRIWRFPDGLLK